MHGVWLECPHAHAHHMHITCTCTCTSQRHAPAATPPCLVVRLVVRLGTVTQGASEEPLFDSDGVAHLHTATTTDPTRGLNAWQQCQRRVPGACVRARDGAVQLWAQRRRRQHIVRPVTSAVRQCCSRMETCAGGKNCMYEYVRKEAGEGGTAAAWALDTWFNTGADRRA